MGANDEKNNANPGKIYAAIAGVIDDVSYVAKDKTNKQQGFKYRSVDDVYNVLNPAFAKNKVFIVPRVLERECSVIKTKNGGEMTKVVCKIKFTFFADDGSSIEAVIIGEGIDTGDKATNKAMAVAYKYACFQVFCIPTEDLTDEPESESQELEEGNKQKDKKPAEKKSPKNSKAEAPKQQDAQTQNAVNKTPEDEIITEAMVNTIRTMMNRKGVREQQIFDLKSVTAKDIASLTIREFNIVMKKLEKTPDLVRGDGKNE